MPAISQQTAVKIRRGQYVDFSTLPPASGLTHQAPTQLEEGPIVIKAEDLARSRQIIQDIDVWHQSLVVGCTENRPEQAARAPGLRVPCDQV